MKKINFKEGIRRLVLAIITPLLAFFSFVSNNIDGLNFVQNFLSTILFCLCFLAAYFILEFVICWIIKGFRKES